MGNLSVMGNNDIISIINWDAYWRNTHNKPFNNIIKLKTLIPFCLWNIWITRNNNIFNNIKEVINGVAAINHGIQVDQRKLTGTSSYHRS